MFLLGYAFNKTHKLATLSENATKQTAEIEVIPDFSYRKIEGFLADLNRFVDPGSLHNFSANSFSIKTKGNFQFLAIKGSAHLHNRWVNVDFEMPFFYQNTEGWGRETLEESERMDRAEQTNFLIEQYTVLSEYVEQNYIHWTGLRSQMEIFKDDMKSKGLDVTVSTSAGRAKKAS